MSNDPIATVLTPVAAHTTDTLPDALLASYVPAVVLQRLAAHGGALQEAQVSTLHGALLFADISGFTALTERLAARGPVGIEALVRRLNGYFGRLIDILVEHGGDVLKFAGDALVVHFPAIGNNLADAVLRAASCGLTAQEALLSEREDQEGMVLSLKIAVACGELSCAFIGGERGRWEMVVFGAPLLDAGEAAGSCEPGAVVLSAQAWLQVAANAVSTPLAEGVVRLLSVHATAAAVLAPQPTPQLQGAAARAAWSFVPYAIRARLTSGQGDWLAESRRITVIFLTLPGHASKVGLHRTQEMMLRLQKLIYHVEGSVNKISVDDKGLSLIAVLGMPPLSHEDDARRALQLALQMRELMETMEFLPSIGITTGRAFCGVIGNMRRREYTMIGDIVNLSARLMVASAGGLLCDQATRDGAGSHFEFEAMAPLKLKGKSALVPVYLPRRASGRRSLAQQGCVGREIERAALTRALGRVAEGQSGLLLIESEPGIGKSRLLEEVRALARLQGIPSLHGEADSIERTAAYVAWRPILAALIEPDLGSTKEPAELLAESLVDQPELLAQCAVLNDILPLGLPENEQTRKLHGEGRAATVRALMLALLKQRKPLLLCLDDLQWLDSASWALLLAAVRLLSPLLLVAATRPVPDAAQGTEWRELMRRPGSTQLRLEGLSEDAVVALIRARLAVKKVSEPLAQFVAERTQGSPFFIEQLLLALREGGLLQVGNGQAEVRAGVDLRSQANLPDTVEGLITQRIDRLDPTAQLALKVAAVVGRNFSQRVVDAIFPVLQMRGQLTPALQLLEQHGLTERDVSEEGLDKLATQDCENYIFRQILTLDVAYNLMLFSQRRALHLAVADWTETNVGDHSAVYAVLAHHLVQAGANDRAIHYLVLAGDQALARFACAEAVRLYTEALHLAGTSAKAEVNIELGQCHRQRGHALYLLGRLEEGIEELRLGLVHTAAPVPSSRAGLVWALVTELMRRAVRSNAPTVSGESIGAFEVGDLAHAYRSLVNCHYTRSERLELLLCGLRSLRFAEQLGPTPDLAEALALMSVIAMAAGRERTAQDFEQRAAALLPLLLDPSRRAGVQFSRSVYLSMCCRWQNAIELQEEVVRLAESLSNWRLLQNGLYGMARCAMRCGQLVQSHHIYARIEQLGRRIDNAQAVVWGLSGQLQSQIGAERASWPIRLEALRQVLESERNSGRKHLSPVDYALGTGAIALALLRLGELEAAEQQAIEASELALASDAIATHLLDPLAWSAEIQFAAWRRFGDPDRARRARTERICRLLERYAKKYPFARPIALRIRGEWLVLLSRQRPARQALALALAEAKILDMPCEAARCHHALAQPEYLEPQYAQHRAAAAKLYTQLDMQAELAALQTLA